MRMSKVDVTSIMISCLSLYYCMAYGFTTNAKLRLRSRRNITVTKKPIDEEIAEKQTKKSEDKNKIILAREKDVNLFDQIILRFLLFSFFLQHLIHLLSSHVVGKSKKFK